MMSRGCFRRERPLFLLVVKWCHAEKSDDPTYEIAVVSDIGGFIDGGFNAAAYEGIGNRSTKI